MEVKTVFTEGVPKHGREVRHDFSFLAQLKQSRLPSFRRRKFGDPELKKYLKFYWAKSTTFIFRRKTSISYVKDNQYSLHVLGSLS